MKIVEKPGKLPKSTNTSTAILILNHRTTDTDDTDEEDKEEKPPSRKEPSVPSRTK
jgi:hypothetical protein